MALARVCSCRQRKERPDSAMPATAPAAKERCGSRMSFPGSISCTLPRPVHEGQAPWGELKEKRRGESSAREKPHWGQAWREESTNSSRSLGAIRTNPSPTRRAVSRESARRWARSWRTSRRSTTTSMVCFFFLSSSGGLATSMISPFTRARTKPSRAICSKRLRCSPFFPWVRGARTKKRVPAGRLKMRSTICWTVCPAMGMRQSGQKTSPMEA
ncbi:hypothetical protein HRbin09_01255 [bacterium HR09]|nr:hypothetical protein HRbin09_01255 [bacterium HR09]